jgi:hypothetical protein
MGRAVRNVDGHDRGTLRPARTRAPGPRLHRGVALAPLPVKNDAAVLAAAGSAFSDALHTVAAVTAVAVTGLAFLFVTRLRRVPPLDQAAPETTGAVNTGKELP